MKITAKTSKETLKTFLGLNAKLVKEQDKDLFDRLVYADKMLRKDESKVQRNDLVTLAKEVIKLLGDQCVEPQAKTTEAPQPKAENSVKKTLKGSKKAPAKETPAETEETKEEAPAEQEAPKAPAKKKGGVTKMKTPKKESVKPVEGTDNSDRKTPLAEMFPEVLEIGNKKYTVARDIKNMDDLYEAYNGEQEIVLAFYWSKRLLKQFSYGDGSLPAPKSFEQDLDVTSCMYVSDEKTVSYHLSIYTEALYQVMPDAIPEENGCRYSNGIEFQIYREVTEE